MRTRSLLVLVIGIVLVVLSTASFLLRLRADRSVLSDEEIALREELLTPMERSVVTPGDGRIVVADAGSLKAGDLALAFEVRGKDGAALGPDDLLVVEERTMHVMLVRDDMTDYRHLHPEFKEGMWTVAPFAVEGGDYRMYVDIAPKNETPVVLHVPLRIGGPTLLASPPAPDERLMASDGGVTAMLYPDQWLSAGWRVSLSYVLKNEDGTAPKLQPYLGAYGHLVSIKHGRPDVFLHAQPTGAVPDGGAAGFETFFTEAGRYTLYVQFIADGELRTFPITVDVAEGAAGYRKGDPLPEPPVMTERGR